MPYRSDDQRKAVWASKNERAALKKVRKTEQGANLKRWFKEKWVDVRTGKPCGRRKGEKRGVPYCRPSKKISGKTGKTAGEMSASEKRSKIREKTRLGQPAGSPRRVSPVTMRIARKF
tara:strand:+ start:519 stop:872 length:354 start_codon:yes stop_codon:yes gene_type:complete